MYFIFDTETTGLPKNSKKHDCVESFNKARMISISWLIVDKHKQIIDKRSYIIKPENYLILNSHIHGITTERALSEGRELNLVLKEIETTIIYHNVKALVCHNVDFDKGVLAREFYFSGNRDFVKLMSSLLEICTVKIAKEMYGGKYFKLHDLYKKLYQGEPVEEHRLHTSEYDTLLCYKIFLKLSKILPEIK